MKRMTPIPVTVALIVLLLAALVVGCGGGGESGSGSEAAETHGPEGEGSGGEGEESGRELALDEMYDETRAGARLTLALDAIFIGTVTNTTDAPLANVRVEVHLSNGVELGPITVGDLAPGETVDVEVPVTVEGLAAPFTGWSPHAEVGTGGDAGSR